MLDRRTTGFDGRVRAACAVEATRPQPAPDRGPALDEATEADIRFSVLVARHSDMLRCFLTSLTRQTAVAEDLTQQLWLKLLESVRAGRFLPVDDASVRSYLFAAARNLFLDECVRKHAASRTSSHDPQVLESLMRADAREAEGPDDQCYREHLQQSVRRAIDDLPAAQQDVIRLWMAGSSIEHMVRTTGAPRDTVLSRKKYAFRRLRATLGENAAWTR